MPRKKEGFRADSGFFFYVDTWLGSEIRNCSPGATGLWINMLATMWKQYPPGALPGDREGLGQAMAVGSMVDAWWEVWGVHLAELERHRVFSRGEDIDDDLEPNSIVNRRMYFDWCRSINRSAQASKAANIRWSKAQRKEERERDRAIIRKIDAEIEAQKVNAKVCSIDAEGIDLVDAHAMLNECSEVIDIKPLAENSRCSMDAEKKGPAMLTECHSKPNYTKTKPKSSEPERVENIIPLLKPDLSGKGVFGRICRLTGAKKPREPWQLWWKGVVKKFDGLGFLIELDGLVTRAESGIDFEGNPIVQARRFMVANVLRMARERQIKVPNHPEATKSA